MGEVSLKLLPKQHMTRIMVSQLNEFGEYFGQVRMISFQEGGEVKVGDCHTN